MSKEIKLDVSKADEAIGKIKQIEEKMKETHKELVEAHNNLKGVWKGESGESFSKYSKVMEENFMKRITMLVGMRQALDAAKVTFVDTDKNVLTVD